LSETPRTVLWVHIGFNAGLDLEFQVNADADLDPGFP
jgi:hypothetical protein